MSNPESFIDEVTEEVRRDKLFGYLRRYGWIGIVAGAADRRRCRVERIAEGARRRPRAEAFGDAVLDGAGPGRCRGARRRRSLPFRRPGSAAACWGCCCRPIRRSDRAAALAALDSGRGGCNACPPATAILPFCAA